METFNELHAKRNADWKTISDRLSSEANSRGYDVNEVQRLIDELNTTLTTPLPPVVRKAKIRIVIDVASGYTTTVNHETLTPDDVYASSLDYDIDEEELSGDAFDDPATLLRNFNGAEAIEFIEYID